MDCEGKEIYEDDIISFQDGKIGLIEFSHGCFVVRYGKNSVQLLYDVKDWKIKILGNRFENPELMIENFPNKKKITAVQKVTEFEAVQLQGSE